MWPNSILSSVKTHENTFGICKKHLKDPQTVRNYILWSDEPQFQASCLKESRHCSSPAEYNPKSKVCCSSLVLWGCSSASGTEGLVRIEEKLIASKYWDRLNEKPVQSIQNLRLGRRFTFQQDNDPKHTARVAYITMWMSLSGLATAWAWTQSNISGETWKCASAPSNLTELER